MTSVNQKVPVQQQIDSEIPPDPSVVCYKSCTRKKDKNMIRCQSCMMWAHCVCVNETSDYVEVWVCYFCRLSSQRITKMVKDMEDFKNETKAHLASLEKKYSDVNNELKALRSTNTDLVQQVQKLQDKNQKLKKQAPVPRSNTQMLVP